MSICQWHREEEVAGLSACRCTDKDERTSGITSRLQGSLLAGVSEVGSREGPWGSHTLFGKPGKVLGTGEAARCEGMLSQRELPNLIFRRAGCSHAKFSDWSLSSASLPVRMIFRLVVHCPTLSPHSSHVSTKDIQVLAFFSPRFLLFKERIISNKHNL